MKSRGFIKRYSKTIPPKHRKVKFKVENLVILIIIIIYTSLVWYQIDDLEKYYEIVGKLYKVIESTP